MNGDTGWINGSYIVRNNKTLLSRAASIEVPNHHVYRTASGNRNGRRRSDKRICQIVKTRQWKLKVDASHWNSGYLASPLHFQSEIKDESAFACFETSFHRFRRTILEGSRFLPARHICLELLVARQETRKAVPPRLGDGEC